MRSNNKLVALAALALGGCFGGYRDPGLQPAPAQGAPDDRYRGAGTDLPMSTQPEYAGPGTSYPGPARRQPRPAPPQADQLQPTYDSPPAYGAQPAYDAPPQDLPPPAPAEYRQPSSQPAYRQPAPRYDAGPVAPAQPLAREDRYDVVGYADWPPQRGSIAAAHRLLPQGSFVEVTALDTGKTILVPVTARAVSTREIELSGAAAELLGFTGRGPAPVRVRRVIASPADEAALRQGRPAAARVDTPPVLLNALRHRLPAAGPAPLPAPAPAPVRATATPRTPAGRPGQVPQGAGFYVQLAAFSSNATATQLARQVGGAVRQAGGVWRVRIGPYADAFTAQRARDDAAGRGYGDARIVRED